jgi:hypothetical protein
VSGARGGGNDNDDDALWDIDTAIHQTGVRWSDKAPLPRLPELPFLPGQVREERDEPTEQAHFNPPPPSPSSSSPQHGAAYIDPYPTLDRKDSVVARAQARMWKPSGGNLAAMRGRQRTVSFEDDQQLETVPEN